MCGGNLEESTQIADEPIAHAGFWISQLVRNDSSAALDQLASLIGEPEVRVSMLPYYASDGSMLCDDVRADRAACPFASPCIPEEACRGGNMCHEAYQGFLNFPSMPGGGKLPERCEICSYKTHYAIGGKCQKCPEQVWVIPTVFCTVAVALCVFLWVLHRLEINFAVLSVGIDYFQVLSLFGNSNIKWPAELTFAFNFMSVLNFNLDLTAPDCFLSPAPTFQQKWMLKAFTPFTIDVVIVSVFIVYASLSPLGRAVCAPFAKLRRHHAVFSCLKWPKVDISTAFGVTLSKYYVFYLFTSKAVLDVFNCQPVESVDPETGELIEGDGYRYMQAVLPTRVRCFEDAEHVRLVPWAVIVGTSVTVGFPAFVAVVMWFNGGGIRKDQILAAHETGHSSNTNPHFMLRKSFSRLYAYYRPECYYWMLVVLARKFAIAMIALVFQSFPSFQLSCVLLVMFVAYVLQLKYTPYMGMIEKASVVKAVAQKKKQKLAEELAVLKGGKSAKGGGVLGLSPNAAGRRGSLMNKMMNTRRMSETRGATRSEKAIKQELEMSKTMSKELRGYLGSSAKFVFSINTVESVLLACSVFVTLAGVMFESERIRSGKSSQVHTETAAITIVVSIVIVASLAFYAVVLVFEVVGSQRINKNRGKLAWKRALRKRRMITMLGGKNKGGGLGGIFGKSTRITPAAGGVFGNSETKAEPINWSAKASAMSSISTGGIGDSMSSPVKPRVNREEELKNIAHTLNVLSTVKTTQGGAIL